jgi:hypothetical protein
MDREHEIYHARRLFVDTRIPTRLCGFGLCSQKNTQAQANHLLEREDLRLRIQVLAVKIIYRWWKRCQRRVAKIEISDLEAEVI